MGFPLNRPASIHRALLAASLAVLLALALSGNPSGALIASAAAAEPAPALADVPTPAEVPLPAKKPAEPESSSGSKTTPEPVEAPVPTKRPPELGATPQAVTGKDKTDDGTAGEAAPEDARKKGETPADTQKSPPAAGKPAGDGADTKTETEPEAKTPADTPGLEEDPAELAACQAALDELGTVYTREKPIDDPGACGIRAPISVSAILPGVALRPENRMRCAEALALARWTHDFVIPASRLLGKGVKLTGIEHASAYVCRARNGDGSGKVSEHAYGNALDVAGFTFRNHEPLAVAERDGKGNLEEAFQAAVRGAACLFFTTVLGPGTNAEHGDHLHLDVIARSRGFRLCE